MTDPSMTDVDQDDIADLPEDSNPEQYASAVDVDHDAAFTNYPSEATHA